MIAFPNCKINLGLHITGKRADGYHDIQTIFLPIPITDILEIIDNSVSNISGVDLTVTGLPVSAVDNLCIKAYNLLKNDFPGLPSIKMHLHKVIPLGAGLGGGSSDAAYTLRLLNDTFSLGLTTEQLIAYALRLGSDCPFFIINKPCYATGRGEISEPLTIDLSGYKILIINPGIHVETKWAFSQISPKPPSASIKEIILQPVEAWQDKLQNDFEGPVFTAWPEIGEIKNELYRQGAVYAAMTGSGSTLYGLFKKEYAVDQSMWSKYFNKIIYF